MFERMLNVLRVDGRMNLFRLKVICAKLDTHLRCLWEDKIAEVVLIVTLCRGLLLDRELHASWYYFSLRSMNRTL